jgi:hypothetical protein
MNMNKTLFKICFVIAAMMAFGSTAYGVNTISGSGTSLGGGTFAPSTNVVIAVESVATGYDAKSGHTTGGDRQFGTNNNSPKMYWTTKAKAAAPGVGGTTTDYTGGSWTSL